MRALLLAALLSFSGPVAAAAEVELNAADGTVVHADEVGRGSHGVLLIHDADRSRGDWKMFMEKVRSEGFRVLAVDLRGHGKAKEITQADPDYASMPDDVLAGLAHLQERGVSKITVIGAGLGANLAVAVAEQATAITDFVLLSPGLNLNGFKPSQSLAGVGDRPVMLLAAKEDGMASATVGYLDKKLTGITRKVVIDGSHRGPNLLDEHPDLYWGVMGWLNGRYEMAEGSDMDGVQVQTGDVEQMESKGERYGEE